jgi:hypothetical protein
MSIADAPDRLGPLEKQWERFRARVLDAEVADDEAEVEQYFLCGVMAALNAIRDGAEPESLALEVAARSCQLRKALGA